MTTLANAFFVTSRPKGTPVSAPLEIVNLVESGFPTAETVCKHLDRVIRRSRRAKVPALKLIHGYGSNGIAELLRFAIRVHLQVSKRTGDIRMYVTGENWSPFDEGSREVLRYVPESIIDSDLGRANRGITLVLL
jgi:hypothetical protein